MGWFTQSDCDAPVNCVLFSQKLYWLIIGTEAGIKVLDLPPHKFVQDDITCTSMKPNESAPRRTLDASPLPGASLEPTSSLDGPTTISASTRSRMVVLPRTRSDCLESHYLAKDLRAAYLTAGRPLFLQ